MYKGLMCAQCTVMTDKLYPDPRPIPLDEGDCLCSDCAEAAQEEIAEE